MAVAPGTHEISMQEQDQDHQLLALNTENVQVPALLNEDVEIERSRNNEEIPAQQDTDDNNASAKFVTDDEFRDIVASLNTKQREVYDTVTDTLRKQQLYQMQMEEENPGPVHLFITGCYTSHLDLLHILNVFIYPYTVCL